MSDDAAAFQDQIGHFLDMADELLQPVERDALRMAIRQNRSDGLPLSAAVPFLMPRASNIGDRILWQLEDADKELSTEDVAKLEQLVQDRLDVGI